MTSLEQNIKEIKEGIGTLQRRELSKGRPLLYVMVFLAMVGVNILNIKTNSISNKLDSQPLQTKNIVGNTIPERFYVIGSDTAIVSYDGKQIIDYFEK